MSMLSEALRNARCVVTHHANGDILIVKTAVKSARTNTMVLVEDDTDLQVLLGYHASNSGCELNFRLEPKANSLPAYEESQRTAG